MERVRELWEKLKGKGPAAAVALSLDLGVARDNQPFNLEAGGLLVEKCDGDLYVRVNGPNGDGIDLRRVRKLLFPISALYLTNSAQSGKAARVLLLPAGLEAHPSEPREYCGWQEADVAANVNWTVPPGKLYEVYAYLTAWQQLLDLNSRVVCDVPGLNNPIWFPCFGFSSIGYVWRFDLIDPVTGVVTFQGNPPSWSTLGAMFGTSKMPSGWILSGDEGLKSTSAWRVRWRERPDLGYY